MRFHSIQILSRNNQRGLYAISDINSGDIIINIPRRAAIIADIGAETPSALHVFRDIAPSFWSTASWEIRLAILLLDECARGPKSPFQSYVEALPSNPWSALWAYQTIGRQKLLENLRPYKMHNVADSYRAYVKSVFAAFQNALPTAASRQVSLRQFSWAMCICQSRAFGVPTKEMKTCSEQGNSASGDKRPLVPLERKKMVPVQYALFPGLDMANHSVHYQASIKYDPASDQYNVVSGAKFAAGQEVLVSYGHKSNDDLMFFYGFAEGENPANTVKITDFREWILSLAYSKCDSNQARRDRLQPLLRSRFTSTDELYEFRQSEVSENLMQLLRLAVTKNEDLTSLLKELETNPDRLTKPLSLENELSCWHAIDEKSQQLLNDLEEFNEEEQQRLSEIYSTRPCSAMWRWSEPGSDGELIYRYERRTILNATSERVRHFARISSAVGRVCTVLMPPTQSILKMDIFNDKEDKERSGLHKFFISPEDLGVV